MSTYAPLPADHPMMVAWEAFKATEEFKNALRWALATKYDDGRPIDEEFRREHVLGSLWRCFAEGAARIAELEAENARLRNELARYRKPAPLTLEGDLSIG